MQMAKEKATQLSDTFKAELVCYFFFYCINSVAATIMAVNPIISTITYKRTKTQLTNIFGYQGNTMETWS